MYIVLQKHSLGPTVSVVSERHFSKAVCHTGEAYFTTQRMPDSNVSLVRNHLGSVAPSRRIPYARRKVVANSMRNNAPVAPSRAYICDGANMVLNLYSLWRKSKAVVNIHKSRFDTNISISLAHSLYLHIV